jgi:hypothetical protein
MTSVAAGRMVNLAHGSENYLNYPFAELTQTAKCGLGAAYRLRPPFGGCIHERLK